MALIKELKKETIAKEWRIISMVFAQLILLVLIVVQFLEVIGLHVNFHLREFVLKPTADPVNLVILAIAVIVFALLYFSVKKSYPRLFEAQKNAPGIIKDVAKEKILKMKSEPQAPALLLIEFLFVAVVVVSLRAYLDPGVELIPWSRLGLEEPVTTIVNAVIAFAVLVIFYRMYGATKHYRKG